MGSTDATSIINQMEQEMEELQQMQYSTEYSADINSKMQIPTRLSMGQPGDGNSYTDSGALDQDYPTNSPAHAMNVPERIMVAGSDTHVGSRQTPRHLDFEEMTAFPTADTVVGLTTPPHTLKMDDVRFPTVGDQSVVKPDRSSMNLQRISNGPDDTVTSPSELNTSSAAEGGPVLNARALQRHLQLINRRVGTLEADNLRRDRRELLFFALGAIYLAYKGLRLLYRIM